MFVTKLSIDSVFRDIQGQTPCGFVEEDVLLLAAEFELQMLSTFRNEAFGNALLTTVDLEVIKVRFRAHNTLGTDAGVMDFEAIFSRWPGTHSDEKFKATIEFASYDKLGCYLRPLREVSKKEARAQFAATLEKWWPKVLDEFLRGVRIEKESRFDVLCSVAKAYATR